MAAGILLLSMSLAQTLSAQGRFRTTAGTWVGAPAEEYVRLLQLTGVMPLSSRILRPSAARMRWSPPDSATWRAPWARWYNDTTVASESADAAIRVFNPVLELVQNSAIPDGMNDAAMWAGRGASFQATAGAAARIGPLRLQLVPAFTWSENRAFRLSPLFNAPPTALPFADQWLSERIDRPQRFGDGSFSRLDAGQSAVYLERWNVKLGVSNESMWWGPGVDNALLMTNNAPGFAHVTAGTRLPANVGIGRLEVLYTLGWLRQSDYWRAETDTFATDRWLNALSLVFEPRGAPGMYIGAGRLFYAYQRYNPITPGEMLTILQTFSKEELATPDNPQANDLRDQMLSIWFRWVFPSVGFEAYGEWGRNDHNWNWRDFILEPDHSHAHVLGARKVFRVRNGLLLLSAERADVANSRTMFLRGTPIWYAHHRVQQGYTQRGQVVGAGIGPGGDQQRVSADWYVARGAVGLVIQRRQSNSDSFYRAYNTNDGAFQQLHDVIVSIGPRLTLLHKLGSLHVEYELANESNRYNEFRNDLTNHRLTVQLGVSTP